MALDYSKGCVNFRDVGEFVNLLAAQPLLPTGRIYRGGKLDYVACAGDIGSPSTIINLRKSKNTNSFGARVLEFPISNDYEKYQTANRQVRRWLNSVITAFEDEAVQYPVLIHCTSGKDRTGVVVAALLKILQVPEPIIVEEYLPSDGEVNAEWIMTALDGIGDPAGYFDRVDTGRIRTNIHRLRSNNSTAGEES